MTTIDTAHLRELAEAATPGPWWSTRDVNPPTVWAGDGSAYDLAISTTFANRDAAYSAAANPETILALLDEVDQLRRWKAEAMAVLSDWDGTWQAAGRPGRIGTSKAVGVREHVAALQARIDAAEDYVTRHYLDTQMGGSVLAILSAPTENGEEQ